MSREEFNNPVPVAVGIIRVIEGNVVKHLGLVRATHPVGGIAFPSGFVEEMESIEEAIAREVSEETGLSTLSSEWRLTHSRTTRANESLIFCELIPVKTPSQIFPGFMPNNETSALVLLDADSQLCYPFHQEALGLAMKSQRTRLEQAAIKEHSEQSPRAQMLSQKD